LNGRLFFSITSLFKNADDKQAVDISGGIVHAHTVYRDPRLAALSQEELQALDGITKKLAVPALDAPHNQIESDTAIEAIPMVPDALTDKESRT
jgi:hypothetical protein